MAWTDDSIVSVKNKGRVKGLQLKRLEAYGFKSFADKISIDFDKGITAIVGPNGSGKSNITDAIRWVLGEQNIRNLRGTKAEDIIFTGQPGFSLFPTGKKA